MRKLGNYTSCLYVPGNSSKMLRKTVQFKPACLVPDIEDSVPLEKKADARATIR